MPRTLSCASMSDEPAMKALYLIFFTRRSVGNASSFG